MGDKTANLDRTIAHVAAQQHGVVAQRQLLATGIGRNAVSKRCRNGRLHRIHRGVYAVGHAGLSIEGRWMAAVLACGESAALSHHGAAALWKLLDPKSGPVDVSVPTTAGRSRRAGIRLHRIASLDPRFVTRRRGIPVTTPARTIADLRRTATPAQQRRAIRQAEVLGLRTGLGRPSEPTRSELEHLFLRLCEHHRLPPPEVNVQVGPYEVDFLWQEERVIVETDGYRFHRGSAAFEADHDRELGLRSRGFDLHRFSYRQVTTEPNRIAASLAEALGRPPS